MPGRETGDADFGASFPVIADPRLPAALRERGYAQDAGNRFVREQDLDGVPARLVVDLLAPSYQGRLVPNQAHGGLVVDEVPGLAIALARTGTPVSARVRLTSGRDVDLDLVLPDVQSALCMKALAYEERVSDRDAVDIWRLLEVALVAGVGPDDWAGPAGVKADAAEALRRHFRLPASRGPRRASARSADQARIRALVARVVG